MHAGQAGRKPRRARLAVVMYSSRSYTYVPKLRQLNMRFAGTALLAFFSYMPVTRIASESNAVLAVSKVFESVHDAAAFGSGAPQMAAAGWSFLWPLIYLLLCYSVVNAVWTLLGSTGSAILKAVGSSSTRERQRRQQDCRAG